MGRLLQGEFFSYRAHWRSLFDSRQETAALDGWRALSVVVLFVFHLFFTVQEVMPFGEYSDFFHLTPWWLYWVWGGDRGVDIFFVLSGYLIATSLFKEQLRQGALNLRRFWWRRFLRLAPVYYVLLVLYGLIGAPNAQNLWANALYINNYFDYADGAMLWSWSLAVEMQFYVLFPLLLVGAYFKVRYRWALLLGCLVLAAIIRGWVLWHDSLLNQAEPWQFMLDKPIFDYFFSVFYDNLYTRFGALVVGVMAAALGVYHCDLCDRWLCSRWSIGLAWLSLVVVVALHFLPGLIYRVPSSSMGGQGQFLYLILHRYVYSAAIAWLMLFSLFGRGALFRAMAGVLTRRFWAPLARLSYSVYLTHIIVIFLVYQNHLSEIPAAHVFAKLPLLGLSSAAATLFIATLLYVFVERPFMVLRR